MKSRTCLSRSAFVFHVMVAIMSILAGIAFLALEISTRRLNHGSKLPATQKKLVHGTWLMLFCSAPLLFGVASLLSAKRHCIGVTFRIVYLLCSVLLICSLGIFFVIYLLGLKQDLGKREAETSEEWEKQVASSKEDVCLTQAWLKCRGFHDGDCDGCEKGKYATTCKNPKLCPDCSLTPMFDDVPESAKVDGCYKKEVNLINAEVRAFAVISGTLLFVYIADLLVTCHLPVHVADLVLRPSNEADGDVTA